jgi:hypothetical protein
MSQIAASHPMSFTVGFCFLDLPTGQHTTLFSFQHWRLALRHAADHFPASALWLLREGYFLSYGATELCRAMIDAYQALGRPSLAAVAAKAPALSTGSAPQRVASQVSQSPDSLGIRRPLSSRFSTVRRSGALDHR